ncbi:UNVERIFIED_ORG: site-specific recombinase XerD [Anoxybacillus amylolyticus]
MKDPLFLRDFLIYLQTVKGYSKLTVQEYRKYLRLFFRFIQSQRNGTPMEKTNISIMTIDDVASVTLEDMYLFLHYCESERHHKPATRKVRVQAIRAFYMYAKKVKGWIEKNPAEELETPRLNRRLPVYLQEDEARRLLVAAQQQKKHKYRTVCMVTLMLHLGLRLSELCQLRLSSIQNDWIRIVGKGNKERMLPLNESCKQAISDYLVKERPSSTSDFLFITQKKTPIRPRTVQRIIKTLAAEAGISDKVITPHKLRHTAATLLHRNGADIRTIQQLLGHENVSTTQIYTHVEKDQLQDIVSKNPLNHRS